MYVLLAGSSSYSYAEGAEPLRLGLHRQIEQTQRRHGCFQE